jgi:tetratricopeptide (TPR) repeat protein
VPPPDPRDGLVGRDEPLARLRRLVARLVAGHRVTALIAGEAGIGKTSLLHAAAAMAAEQGARTAWGTCVDSDGAPGYWPWTQALDGLVRDAGAERVAAEAGDDVPLLRGLVPSLAAPTASPAAEPDARARLLAMDAAGRLLESAAATDPLLVVIDDLQWADESSLALFDVVAAAPRPARLGLVGAYRPDELRPAARRRIGELVARAEHLQVGGLDADAVRQLVERLTGQAVEPAAAAAIHRRTGGHPFFVRELALLPEPEPETGHDQLPVAVRDAIARRLARLPAGTVAVVEAAAVTGPVLLPDVVGAALGLAAVEVESAAGAAVDAGVLVRTGGELRFRHDLMRESALALVDHARRVELHRALGAGLETRRERGGQVPPADLARHFVAAIALDGPDRAVRWALRAAAADSAALAFGEAAAHLRRLRAAAADAGVDIDRGRLVDVLVAEADACARAGRPTDARGLLRHAADLATRGGDARRTAQVAQATALLGARFAERRDETVRELRRALDEVAGVDDVWEARLTATLARELQHSVPADRPQARPLSERALELGRRTGDHGTLLACLLARHDVLWTPGTAAARADVARELVDVALAAGDADRHAEGLLLLANALLEQGSPAFESALDACLAILDASGQPRHRYLADTRRAGLALLRGRLDEAAELIERAAALGERIREPDTGNVRMSQRLELVRARGDAGEMRAFADLAVRHWTGAPVHAHAVAAGFCARAGAPDDARRHVTAVLDAGTWRADRSYLWSVLVRELAHAAVALDDRELCAEVLADLRPLTGSCGVNGALVAFAGSHDHPAALLAAALGDDEAARHHREAAAAAYRHLDATGWLAELTTPPGAGPERPAGPAAMRRRDRVWELTFAGRTATVPHSKGLADIATLLAARGAEVHVLQLAGSPDRSGGTGDVVDRTALEAYRRRLAELEAGVDDAARDGDPVRRARREAERQALVDELARVTGAFGRPRQFGNHPAERARKAVAGRVRDAIRKLEPVHPELAAHLSRAVVTGTYCRYRATDTAWEVSREGTG